MDGIQRLAEMAEGQKDFVLLEIVKYLTSREDMNEKYLNKEKNLKGMAYYIRGELIKTFCEQNNTNDLEKFAQDMKYNGKNVKYLMVGMSNERTFELAIDYFNKSNEELGIKPEETKKIETKNKNEDDEFGSIFETKGTIVEKKKDEIEQISLFSM